VSSRPPIDPWDHAWSGAGAGGTPDLSAPTLENAIDEGKLRFLESLLPVSGRVVEVGCGSARLLARVSERRTLGLLGVDASEAALGVARATSALIGRPIRTIRADARALPLASGSFDGVLSGGLLEHFENPGPVLSEMVRILRPGGLFYADVVPRKFSLYRLADARRMARSPWLLPGVYESSLGSEYYARTLRRLGCTGIRVAWAGVYPRRGALRCLPWTRVLDGTRWAAALGWYFMVAATRAEGRSRATGPSSP
jgi:SAM-dependent methyltransferase